MTASEALDAFRASAPVRRLQRGGVEWHYRISSGGPRALLLLPGAVGDGDVYFTLAPMLSSTHTLIAIAYPPVDLLTRLLDGLRDILDREHLDSTDIVGGSFGGLIAQAFLRRFPQRTRRVVLSATGPARPDRAASNERFARLMGRLPMGITRVLLRLIVRVSLMPVTMDRAFWRGARDSLRSLYPGAQVCTFPGAGHAISAECRDQWAEQIATFLLSTSLGSDTRHGV